MVGQGVKPRHDHRNQPVMAGFGKVILVKIGQDFVVDPGDEAAQDIGLATDMGMAIGDGHARGLDNVDDGDVMPAFSVASFRAASIRILAISFLAGMTVSSLWVVVINQPASSTDRLRAASTARVISSGRPVV